MSRYIDADKIEYHMIYGQPIATQEQINSIPTADVRENKYGEWIKDEGGFDTRDNFYHCSKCGRTINLICCDTLESYPFCHCGADMRGKEDE